MPVEQLPVSLKEMNPAEKSHFAVHFFCDFWDSYKRRILQLDSTPKYSSQSLLMWSWYLGNTNRVLELQEHKVRGGLLDGWEEDISNLGTSQPHQYANNSTIIQNQ